MVARYTLGRLLQALVVIIGITLIVFIVSHLTGDPTYLMVDPTAKQSDIIALRQKMGLDQPLSTQYWRFLSGAVRGDFGDSLWQQQPALTLVTDRLPYTLALTFSALGLAVVLAVPMGLISAIFRGGIIDRVAMGIALLGQCIPSFWLGLMMILLFSLRLGWFPTSGSGGLKHLILPAVSLAAYAMGRVARLTRSAMLDVLGQDYVRTAKAKGLSALRINGKHALRNAAIPIITVLGLDVSALLGGAVVTETVFAWPGLGRLVIQAIGQRDFPLVQASVMFIAAVVIGINLVVDLCYLVLDPRVKYG